MFVAVYCQIIYGLIHDWNYYLLRIFSCLKSEIDVQLDELDKELNNDSVQIVFQFERLGN